MFPSRGFIHSPSTDPPRACCGVGARSSRGSVTPTVRRMGAAFYLDLAAFPPDRERRPDQTLAIPPLPDATYSRPIALADGNLARLGVTTPSGLGGATGWEAFIRRAGAQTRCVSRPTNSRVAIGSPLRCQALDDPRDDLADRFHAASVATIARRGLQCRSTIRSEIFGENLT